MVKPSDNEYEKGQASMYQLTDEHVMMRDMARDLAEDKDAPRAAELDERDEFAWDLKLVLASNDLLALPFPERYGGTGTDSLTLYLSWRS